MSKPTEIAVPDDSDESIAAPVRETVSARGFYPSAKMEQALAAIGVKPADIRHAAPPMFWGVAWEDLCVIDTKDDKVKVSPILTVTKCNVMPEDTGAFKDYVGMVYCEAVTEEGEYISFTTSYAYKESGEMLPLAEWLTKQPPPFPLRIARIETRKPGRHVIRPISWDLG